MKPYTDLPGFEGVYLEESCILDIEARPGVVSVSADFVLTPTHDEYADPRAGEKFCYRRGRIRFAGVERLMWVGGGAPPAVDASGELDYGTIDTFEWDEVGSRLEGGFGRIEIRAETIELAIDE